MKEKIVDKLGESAINLMEEYILNSIKDYSKKNLWKKIVNNACVVTEGFDEKLADYIAETIAVQRHFLWLASDKPLTDIYHSFIVTIAVELSVFNLETNYAISFAEAILDNWFEANGIDYRELKNPIQGDEIEKIVHNRERLYREYFMLYDDPYSRDIIRVYYPKNGQNWIEWNKEYSIDIRVNLSKGTEFGFCRPGFSYTRVDSQKDEKFLHLAYIYNDREIFRFEFDSMDQVGKQKVLWLM